MKKKSKIGTVFMVIGVIFVIMILWSLFETLSLVPMDSNEEIEIPIEEIEENDEVDS